jgi:hypothetical protein
MLSVIMLSVVMLNVVAPNLGACTIKLVTIVKEWPTLLSSYIHLKRAALKRQTKVLS